MDLFLFLFYLGAVGLILTFSKGVELEGRSLLAAKKKKKKYTVYHYKNNVKIIIINNNNNNKTV